jgi:hypothetical protein
VFDPLFCEVNSSYFDVPKTTRHVPTKIRRLPLAEFFPLFDFYFMLLHSQFFLSVFAFRAMKTLLRFEKVRMVSNFIALCVANICPATLTE